MFRAWRRKPGFPLVVILLLGLGMGLNAAVFSLIDAYLLRPLPYPKPDRIITIWAADPRQPRHQRGLTPDELFVSEAALSRIASIATYVDGPDIGFDLSVAGRALRAPGAVVDSELFSVLGISTLRGRPFTAEEGQPGGPDVAILSYRIWRSRFASEPGVIGRTVTVSGIPRTIVGVLPLGLDFPAADVWVPRPLEASRAMNLPLLATYNLRVVGRLRDGMSGAAVLERLKAVDAELQQVSPGFARQRLVAIPLAAWLRGDLARVLSILLAACGLLLAMTCANLANLFLARTTAQRGELALRLSLGASRARLSFRLGGEVLVLGLLASLVGLGVGWLVIRVVVPLAADFLPQGRPTPGLAGRPLALLLGLALICGTTTALFPALAGMRHLRSQLSASHGGRGRRQLWASLIAVQVLLAFVLIACGSLMAQSVTKLLRRELGFEPRGVLALELVLNQARTPSPEARAALVERVVRELQATPGVVSVAAANGLPLVGGMLASEASVERGSESDVAMVDVWAGTPGLLATLRIPLLEGRGFLPTDTAASPAVAILDTRLARRFWPGRSALGQRVQVQGEWREVVGVAGPVEPRGLREAPLPVAYVPWPQFRLSWPFVHVVARAASAPQGMVPGVRAAVRRADPEQPIAAAGPYAEAVREQLAAERLITTILCLFSGAGVVFAFSGVSFLVAYRVARQRREIGIRVALGARARQIVSAAAGPAARAAVLGIVLGCLATLAVSATLAHFLVGLSARDPATLAMVGVALVGITLAAALLTARRALRIDPAEVLREH